MIEAVRKALSEGVCYESGRNYRRLLLIVRLVETSFGAWIFDCVDM